MARDLLFLWRHEAVIVPDQHGTKASKSGKGNTMHIQPVTQIKPAKAQLGADTAFTAVLGKIQAVASTVVSVTDAISAVSKSSAA